MLESGIAIRYKNYIIDPCSFERRDGLGWTSSFSIFNVRDFTDTIFLLRESFPAKEAALAAAIVTGTQQIDAGFVPKVVFGG